MKEKEIWKEIPEYNNYMISTLGNLIEGTEQKNRKIKGSINNGYRQTTLRNNKGKRKTFNFAVLVAMAFMKFKPNWYFKIVDHKNTKNKLDDSLSNLQIITNRENISKDKTNKTGYLGVSFVQKSNNYKAIIKIKGVTRHLGCFFTAKEAHNQYNLAVAYLKDYENPKQFRKLLNNERTKKYKSEETKKAERRNK